MTIQKARPYIQNFLKGFFITGAIKFLIDEYVLHRAYSIYSLLFYSIWMGLIFTWLYHRQRKKAVAGEAEG